ncbi:MAG: Rrf2 family transcriptional regulator [Actinobacteria bacterium]|nr:Rrf2 family transcriptional regulator [Actinomycetota bacterium]
MQLSLTKQGQYGVRLLIHLATLPDGTRRTAQELASACAIPSGNVATVVHRLSRGGFLSCTPGRNGGCTLARPPSEISLLDIVGCLEGSLDISHCLLDGRRCTDKQSECALHFAWVEGRQAAIGSLSATTLRAAADREVELRGTGAVGSTGAVDGDRPRSG